jgi:hypothetical protein
MKSGLLEKRPEVENSMVIVRLKRKFRDESVSGMGGVLKSC